MLEGPLEVSKPLLKTGVTFDYNGDFTNFLDPSLVFGQPYSKNNFFIYM